MAKKKLSVRELAVREIKKDLKLEHKTFISFLAYLNPVMDTLVEQQIEEQKKIKKNNEN